MILIDVTKFTSVLLLRSDRIRPVEVQKIASFQTKNGKYTNHFEQKVSQRRLHRDSFF